MNINTNMLIIVLMLYKNWHDIVNMLISYNNKQYLFRVYEVVSVHAFSILANDQCYYSFTLLYKISEILFTELSGLYKYS